MISQPGPMRMAHSCSNPLPYSRSGLPMVRLHWWNEGCAKGHEPIAGGMHLNP
jgi:hypothetical protein